MVVRKIGQGPYFTFKNILKMFLSPSAFLKPGDG